MGAPIAVTTVSSEYSNLDKEILNKMISQSLEGVMFHSFEVDLFDMLNLCGFKKMHQYQVEEESALLNELKHKYIQVYHILPQIQTNEISYWKDASNISAAMTETEKSDWVKKSLKQYSDWESTVLENLFKWKRNASNKNMFSEAIKDVMEEIERIDTLTSILNEHEYHFQCIQEVSEYLYKKF